jgi:FAD/FMN-containing dehydrogenase
LNIESLRRECSGDVLLPESDGYEEMRQCWNRAVQLHPTAIVMATNAADMQACVRFAAEHELKILVQSTGHGASAQTGDYLLIVTTRMDGIAVDASAQTARIEAGAVWGDVLKETQLHGLAPLLGSSGTVGVVGYTLGGGIGWLARQYGMAVDSVLSIDAVTANGETVRASSSEHPDLYWALCGGSGGFAIVAAIEVKLYPVTTVWGGSVTYPITHATEVFSRYREWTTSLPEAMTSSVAIVNYPDVDAVPRELRGTSAVVVKGCHCGAVDAGRHLTSSWTNWKKPIADTFAAMPFANVAAISHDPVDPVPAFAAGGDGLRALSNDSIAILIQYATTDGTTKSGKSPFLETEVRHVDSRTVRAPGVSNAFTPRDATFILDIAAAAPTPQSVEALRRYTAEFKRVLRPHTSGDLYLNFTEKEEAQRAARGHDSERITRLRAIKRQVDAQGLFISAHPLE